jgi:hypothetical protein
MLSSHISLNDNSDSSLGTATGQPQASITQSGSFPTTSLPAGGSSIGGIGEKFKVNAANGTGSLAIPIPTSAGRGGFGPAVSLNYDSGSGNGPFGLGWTLSIPEITRKTAKGIPKYLDAEESDVFILNGAEDLVPTFQTTNQGVTILDKGTGDPVLHSELRNGFLIRRYRPRIEGTFSRIERWTKVEGKGKDRSTGGS